jgi:hypothetical protein
MFEQSLIVSLVIYCIFKLDESLGVSFLDPKQGWLSQQHRVCNMILDTNKLGKKTMISWFSAQILPEKIQNNTLFFLVVMAS